MQKDAAQQSGLTLVEVMIALTVAGLIAGVAWDLFLGSLQGYRRGLREVALTQEARLVFSIITRDFQRAVTVTDLYGPQGPGAASIALTGRSEPSGRLLLTAVAPLPAEAEGPAAERPALLQRIRYLLEPTSAAERPQQGNSQAEGIGWPRQAVGSEATLILKRAAVPLGGEEAERVIPLSKRLRELDLHYFDGQSWSNTWRRPGRPRALEIALVLQDGASDSHPQRFATIVALE